jgi:carnitine O-acetyltransferase
MAHDWFYQVDVYDEHRNLLPPATIESSLHEVVLDVNKRLQEQQRPVPIGVLTADDRDVWTKVLLHQLFIHSYSLLR